MEPDLHAACEELVTLVSLLLMLLTKTQLRNCVTAQRTSKSGERSRMMRLALMLDPWRQCAMLAWASADESSSSRLGWFFSGLVFVCSLSVAKDLPSGQTLMVGANLPLT